MKKFFLLFVSAFILIFSNLSFSYKVSVWDINWDIKTEWNSEISSDWNNYYTSISKTVNKYLWIFMWTVSLIVVIYAGFLLMSSNWASEDLKKANKMLTWWVVWIFVSLLSYIIVKLLIGLF